MWVWPVWNCKVCSNGLVVWNSINFSIYIYFEGEIYGPRLACQVEIPKPGGEVWLPGIPALTNVLYNLFEDINS